MLRHEVRITFKSSSRKAKIKNITYKESQVVQLSERSQVQS